ncbi:hypothetical protein ACHWQZ_G015933 [Mnemiopsis leidyi]
MTQRNSARITVFNKFSPSIAKLWRQKDQLNKCSYKGAETRLDKEKKTAMKELNRAQNLLLRERGQPSRPVTRASTLWGAVEHNSRISSPGQTRRGKSAEVNLRSASALGKEEADSLSLRREATFCKSLNQVCNASEKEKLSWEKRIFRQQQHVSSLDDKSVELILPVSRGKSRSQRKLKCKSEAFPEEDGFSSRLLSSRSLIMASSVFLTSSQSFQSEVPRYVRLRGGKEPNLRYHDNVTLTVTPATETSLKNTSFYLPDYNPEEYTVGSEEDLSE